VSRKEPLFYVKSGPVSVRVNAYKDGRFFFRRKTSEGWQTVVRTDRKDIETEAKDTAKLIAEQKAAVIGLKGSEVRDFLLWRADQKKAVLVSKALKDYVAAKDKAKLSAYHFRAIKGLEKILAPLESKNIRSLTPADIEAAIPTTYRVAKEVKPIGPRRRNNIIEDICAFFRWCRKQQILPDGITAPERIDRHQEPAPQKEFFTVAEFEKIFPQISDAWRPWFAIACFAGLRSEEIQALKWEDVDLKRAMINVRAEIAKTGHRRLVPIQPNLSAFLALYGKRTGQIPPMQTATKPPAVARIDNYIRGLAGWKKNGPRHSFGSYRLAVTQNAAQLAEEMGNSIAMIRKHYAEAVHPEDGTAWFAIVMRRPENVVALEETA
jgi:integrase